MTDEQFKREMLYQATLSIARAMLNNGLISPDEYGRINEFLKAKYKPPLGGLRAEKP